MMKRPINPLTLISRILLATGILLGIVALFWLYGTSSIFAQTDTTAPTVSSVAVTSDPDTGADFLQLAYDDDGVYGIGDEIEVTVTFSEDVTVTGSPRIELDIGGSARAATYDSTSGSKVVFSYTVATGDNDTDGIAIGANKVTLKGGAIKDADTIEANLSHSALSTQSGHKVDGIRPTITRAPYFRGSSSNQDDVHSSGEIIPVAVEFSEDVIAIGAQPVIVMPQLKLNVGGKTRYATFEWAFSGCEEDEEEEVSWGSICVYSPGPWEWRGYQLNFEYTVVKGDLDLDGVATGANAVSPNGGTIKDAAGNDAILTHSAVAADSDIIVDAVPATVKSIVITSDPGSDNAYGVGDKIEATVTFSESVRVPRWFGSDGVSMPLLKLNIGGVAKTARTHELSTITGKTLVFSYTVWNGDNDADGIYIGANKLTSQANGGITDNYGGCCPGGENADLRHSAVAESTSHKVRTPGTPSKSSDATLSGLALSGVNFGTFTSNTASYAASVAKGVSQTTVTPALNHSGASYVIKLGGVTDTDGTVALGTGSNVITVEVTSQDGDIVKTYTVTVTRSAQSSTDATLSGLTLSGIDFGTFASGTESYTASVANSVSQTAVTPTVNDSGASYVIKLGGVTDTDGTVSLAVGSNVITVVVTAEDDTTTKTYTVTVTRASPPSTDATLSALTLSGIDIGTFASGTESYTASVANSVSQTAVTPTLTDSDASYAIKLGGVTDSDGTVALAVGENVITVEVTAEDTTTTKTYTITVTRAAPPSSDATLRSLSLSGISLNSFKPITTSYTASVTNSVSQTTVTPTLNDSGASYVIKIDGVTDSDSVIPLRVGKNVITIEVTAEDGETTGKYTVTVTRADPPSTDATLSGLTLSGIDFGTFASGTESYTASVANSVSQTIVTPTVNDSGASYDIKMSGVIDADGTVSLSVGSNVISVVVTAEDDSTTKTYAVTVTRAEPPSTDATLKGLTLSGISTGTFDSTTTSYTVQIANSVSQTTVTPTVNDSGASYVIKIGGVTDADGTVSLSVGSNVITVEVTAEDDSTTKTYTVTVTRAEPPSTDATLSALTLSGINFGTFSSGTDSYTASVENGVSQTIVTATANDSGASYVIKLGGVTDSDGTVALVVGGSVITIEVTAEDKTTTKPYTVTVTRAASVDPVQLSSDASLSSLTLSGADFGAFDSTTESYTASVANSVSQTTVSPVLSDSTASYVIKLGSVVDADGIVSLAVGRQRDCH